MDKKEIRRLIVAFALILLLAMYVDMTNSEIQNNGIISRADIGGDSKELELHLEAENLLLERNYQIEVVPQLPTREMAQEYLDIAVENIDSNFSVSKDKVSIEDTYAEGLVEAEWLFQPSGYVRSDGTIEFEEIPEEGVLMQAQVRLSCGAYEMVYSFPFELEEPSYSKEELLLQGIEEWAEEEMQAEGKEYIQLPSEINGVSLIWSEKKEYLTFKILFLEVAAVVLISLSRKQKKKKDEELRRKEMERSYPDIVNQLTMLLQAGMTMRQAWYKIAIKYEEEKKRGKKNSNEVFEAVLRLNRRLQEGEKERIAYEQFSSEIEVSCYRRLMRTLIGNLEKGNRNLCNYLEEESQRAYEQRVLLARKLGEEASTKMLIPLMIMLILVMFIVIAPAMMGFSL